MSEPSVRILSGHKHITAVRFFVDMPFGRSRTTAQLIFMVLVKVCDGRRHLAMLEGTMLVSTSVCSNVATPWVKKWKMFLQWATQV